MLKPVDTLQELLKSYYVFKPFDKTKSAELLQKINDIRFAIALDADLRNVYFSQINVPANSSGYKQDLFFTRGDINFTIKRGIVNLEQTATVTLLHQGKRQNVITRENLAWQQLFSDVQNFNNLGQQTLFDLPQELFFEQNETLNIGVTGQTSVGNIFLQGCNLKDDYTPNVEALKREIVNSLPAWQVIPIAFRFTGGTGTEAVSIDGGNEIFSNKSDKSIVITHVSITNQNCRISIFDDGRSQQLCDRVEARGVAAQQNNQYTAFYELPYPHLLRRQDRLRMSAINGSVMTSGEITPDELQYLTFAGYTI